MNVFLNQTPSRNRLSPIVMFVACLCLPFSAQATITKTGSVEPDTDPTTWSRDSLDRNTPIQVGSAADGSVTVNGGTTLSSWNVSVGSSEGATGTVTIDGAGSTWAGYNLQVGSTGTGILNITDGGVYSGATVSMGSNAYVTVDGRGSVLNASPGYGFAVGTPYFTISNGGLVNSGPSRINSGTATVTGSGSQWVLAAGSGRRLYVGDSGTGTLNITDGGNVVVNSDVRIGNSSNLGTVGVTGSGSELQISNALYAGYSGSSVLSIVDGGRVNSRDTYIGYSTGSDGSITVDGAESSLAQSGSMTIGSNGTGILNIYNGADVSVASTTTVGSLGSVNFGADGGTFATGTLSYESTSQFTGTGTILLGGYLGDADFVISSPNDLKQTVANWDGSGQDITVKVDLSGANGLTGDLVVGHQNSGSLNISKGVTVSSADGYVGNLEGSTGTASVAGSESNWTLAGKNYIGYSGSGSLSVVDGASVANTYGYLGYNAGSSGTAAINGADSMWKHSTSLYVGNSGVGALEITGGAQVQNLAGYVGYNNGSSGTAVIDGVGSSWTSNYNLVIGNAGAGRVSISDGGNVNANTVQINDLSLLTADLGQGSVLKVGGTGVGTITNAGTIRLVAGAGAANGTYTPMAYGTMTGTGTVQALGGVWDADAHIVTVSEAATAAAGESKTIDLSATQRLLVTDAGNGNSVGLGFLGSTTPTSLTFSASEAGGAEKSSLQSLLAAGQGVVSAWDFTSGAGYNSGDPVYLSMLIGAGFNLSDLAVWHYDGSAWSPFAANDLAYDNQFASFTVTGFSGYAVAAPVPVPAAVWLFGSALAGLGAVSRRRLA